MGQGLAGTGSQTGQALGRNTHVAEAIEALDCPGQGLVAGPTSGQVYVKLHPGAFSWGPNRVIDPECGPPAIISAETNAPV